MIKLFSLAATFLTLLSLGACGLHSTSSDVAFDSDSAILYEAALTDARIILPARPKDAPGQPNEYYWVNIDRFQLRYMVGQLRAQGATVGHSESPNIDSSNFEISSITPLDGGLEEIHYKLKLRAVWPREKAQPKFFPVVVPGRYDTLPSNGIDGLAQGEQTFFDTFGANCVGYESGHHDAPHAWYDYDPTANGCALQPETKIADEASAFFTRNNLTMARFPLELATPLNTTGKKPEYTKIWEDNKLSVLMITMPASDDNQPNDWSAMNIRSIQATLKASFRIISEVSEGQAANNLPFHTKTVYDLSNGKTMELDILHDTGIFDPNTTPQRFADAIKALSPDADLVFYSGHSSYGSAIKRLTQLIDIKPNKYQIYFVNGCSTFFYAGHFLLWDRVKAVNPNVTPSKLVDLILNVDAALFNDGVKDFIYTIDSLIQRKHTYRQLLSRMGTHQRAAVVGEEDNEEK